MCSSDLVFIFPFSLPIGFSRIEVENRNGGGNASKAMGREKGKINTR